VALAVALGTGGRTGVETLNDAVSLSSEPLANSDLGEGLLWVLGLSARLWVTTATIGRRGRLFRIVRLRDGAAESELGGNSKLPELLDDGVCDDESSPWRVRRRGVLEEGEVDRFGELDIQGFRAKLTSLPDIPRVLEGRATGDGALVCGTFGGSGGSEGGTSVVRSSVETVNRETATVGLSLDRRREVRLKISFPAATSSFDGEPDCFWNVRSEKVLRRPGEPGSEVGSSVRLL
jgi:hypothetical protein